MNFFAPSKRQRRFAALHSSRAPGLCSRRRTRNCSGGPAKGTGPQSRCALPWDAAEVRARPARRARFRRRPRCGKNLATDTRTDGASNFQPTTTTHDALPDAAEASLPAVAAAVAVRHALISSIRSAPGAFDPRAAPRVAIAVPRLSCFRGGGCGGGRAGHFSRSKFCAARRTLRPPIRT